MIINVINIIINSITIIIYFQLIPFEIQKIVEGVMHYPRGWRLISYFSLDRKEHRGSKERY